MKRLVLLIAFGIAACEREAPDNAVIPPTVASDPMLQEQTQASKPPAVVPRPGDQAQLDRMILAGYTPHGDHLHPPGVDKCPLTMGSDAVM